MHEGISYYFVCRFIVGWISFLIAKASSEGSNELTQII